jgi:transcriptional regulator
MYIPRSFAESDRDALHGFIERHPLGALVTASVTHGFFATHLPLLLDREQGPFGVLQGHVARANPHHELAASGESALVIFSGPDAYVTPSWYPSKQEHGKVVPTWNYIAVHATGVLRFNDDRDFLMAHLDRLTDRHEASQSHPWAMHDAPLDYLEQLARATVGVEIEITSLEGKFKLSQNRSAADAHGVIAGLEASSSAHDRAVADAMRDRTPQRPASPG